MKPSNKTCIEDPTALAYESVYICK